MMDSVPPQMECVVLLHGLGRTSRSMSKLEEGLQSEGYVTANIDYPSRSKSIEALAPEAINRGVKRCKASDATKIHFVTHSLGGILVRYYLSRNTISELGHVVMLGPPNRGSEVADTLSRVPGFGVVAGPASLQLGTGTSSIPNVLGPVSYSVGIIAGTGSINPVFSALLPGSDDGMVAVNRTRLEGMSDFAAVRASHTFVMRRSSVLGMVLAFLRTGKFYSTQRADQR